MRRIVNQKRRQYQRTYFNSALREEKKNDYFKIKYEYKEKIKEGKIKSWKEFCNSITKSNVWDRVYKNYSEKLLPLPTLSTIEKDDGSYTNTVEETVNLILDKIIPIDNPLTDNEENSNLRAMMNDTLETEEDVPFQKEEIKKIIVSLKEKKAPGIDGITSEIVKKMFQLFPKFHVTLYNECLNRGYFPKIWKKALIKLLTKPGKEDLNDANKYRPISLLPVYGKVLEKLTINRILHKAFKEGSLSEDQYGFIPQTGTVDAIKNVELFIENGLREKSHILLISLDVSGAFNAAWWPALFHQLRQLKIPRNIYKLIINYFSERKILLQTNSATIVRDLSQGCPQGSCSAPGFWIILFDQFLKLPLHKNVRIISFADDLLIMISGKRSKEVEMIGNDTMYEIIKCAMKNKIVFNKNKSCTMHITRKMAKEDINIYMQGEKLKSVDELKYLGLTIDKKFTWKKHVDNISNKSLQIINKLSKVARVHWGITGEALSLLYKAVILPIISYAIPVWKKALTRQYNVDKLLRVQRLMAIRIIKGYRTISYSASNILAGIIPIDIELRMISTLYDVEKGYQRLDEIDSDCLDLPVPHKNWIHPADFNSWLDVQEDDTCFPIVIFTDGSKSDENTGAAFVVYLGEKKFHEEQFKLSSKCSNNQAEALAIDKALKWCQQNVSSGNKVIIKTDSMINLMAVKNGNNHYPLIESINKTLLELWKIQTIQVQLTWVKGHDGITGNEEADRLAKDASRKDNLVTSYNKIPKTYLKSKLHDNAILEWDSRWQNSLTGNSTKRFFPNVQSRMNLNLKESFKLTQILSGHGHIRSYLKRFHVLPDDSCPCDGESEQTVDHLIFRCGLLERQRAPLLRKAVLTIGTWPVTHQQLLTSLLVEEFCKFVQRIDFNDL